MGGSIGAIAGGMAGITGGAESAALGAAVGSVIPGVGTIAGGIIGFLVGMGSGAALGAIAGGSLDNDVFDEYICHACSLTFNAEENWAGKHSGLIPAYLSYQPVQPDADRRGQPELGQLRNRIWCSLGTDGNVCHLFSCSATVRNDNDNHQAYHRRPGYSRFCHVINPVFPITDSLFPVIQYTG